jgi:hypothetical protein
MQNDGDFVDLILLYTFLFFFVSHCVLGVQNRLDGAAGERLEL